MGGDVLAMIALTLGLWLAACSLQVEAEKGCRGKGRVAGNKQLDRASQQEREQERGGHRAVPSTSINKYPSQNNMIGPAQPT
jgi:hypothetical protein